MLVGGQFELCTVITYLCGLVTYVLKLCTVICLCWLVAPLTFVLSLPSCVGQSPTTPYRNVYQNRAKQLFSALLALTAERSKASVDFPIRRLELRTVIYLCWLVAHLNLVLSLPTCVGQSPTTPFRRVTQNRAKQLFSALLALAAERSKASADFPIRRLELRTVIYLCWLVAHSNFVLSLPTCVG